MKSRFLYWSKRRWVHNNVAENFATVLSSPDSDSASGLVEVGGTDTAEHHQPADSANDVVPNEPVYRVTRD